MQEFITVVAMAFVFEGLFYALFPKLAQNLMKEMSTLPLEKFRNFGLIFAIVGAVIVLMIRN